MGERTTDGLLPRALVASALLHATLVGALLRHRPGDVPVRPPRLFAVSLVGRVGGGGGDPSTGPAAAPAGPAPVEPPAAARVATRTPAPSPTTPRRTRPHPAAVPPVETATQPGADVPGAGDVASVGPGGGGGGGGTGDGPGGDGGGDTARPAYGSNPKPAYPLSARRLRIEGVVQLEAVVKPDGAPASVRIVTSSGQPSLDESALTTVRSRWRFVPARQGNTPVESSVVFSIRFELDDG